MVPVEMKRYTKPNRNECSGGGRTERRVDAYILSFVRHAILGRVLAGRQQGSNLRRDPIITPYIVRGED